MYLAYTFGAPNITGNKNNNPLRNTLSKMIYLFEKKNPFNMLLLCVLSVLMFLFSRAG